MTWQELIDYAQKLTYEQKQEHVPILHFSLGSMELLNGITVGGTDNNTDTHCEDIEDYQGKPYLVCGMSVPMINLKID